jgi:hypothetical protein
MAYLCLLGFEVLVLLIGEDEIEQEKPGFDEFNGMSAAVTQVLSSDLRIERFRKEMVDPTRTFILAPVDVPTAFQLFGKVIGPISPPRATEAEILTRHKVAGMRGDNVKEAGFDFGVTEGLQSGDMLL